MYESFFHFTERPFAASPRIDRYYPGQAAETVRLAAARCIERSEGYAVILGASGTGKTLLCQVLAEQFRATVTPLQLAAGQIASRKALFQAILFELGLPFRRRDEGELRLALLDSLAPDKDKSEGLLLLIDEAQSLRSRLFEELRLLSNVVRQGKSRVRLVLAGTGALEERLSHPKLASFQQRVTARCTLRSFSAAETQEYVRAQTAVVGGDPDAIWEDSALQAIHATTDGVPRLINQVCDHALLLAASAGMKRLGARGIDVAWADLQQLPLPEAASNRALTRGNEDNAEEAVIEFGSLDDEFESAAFESPVEEESSPPEAVDCLALPTGMEIMSEPLLSELHDEIESLRKDHSQVIKAAESESPAADDAVYDDFPIVACHRSNTDAVLPEVEDFASADPEATSDDDTIDWIPVPTASKSNVGGLHSPDPVLPDHTVEGMRPLRTFEAGPFESQPVILEPAFGEGFDPEAVDVVTEEDIPAPAYAADLQTRWPQARVISQSTAKQPRTQNAPSRPKREPKFEQLFSTMRQQRVG